ncbi:MAG: glycosyltransferase [Polynucleobacter sp.]|nr:glycosyltransferase [Polynucleobacter sp.]
MKILVSGDGRSNIHEVAVLKSFRQLGQQCDSFYWYPYFNSKNKINKFWLRLQDKFIIGPIIKKINNDFIERAKIFNPKLIFIYRGTHIYPQTITAIRKLLPECKIFGYNNDDPFGDGHPPWLWRHFLKGVPGYDLMFAYRIQNLLDFKKIGVKRTELLRSWYLPYQNYFVNLNDDEKVRYECDIVFIGHFEKDGRLEHLEEIVKNGYKLRLFGPGYEWNRILEKSPVLYHLAPVHLIWGNEYNKAICGAKIALCFFSKLNHDTYTRRCFEIPAAGSLLLSEYSEDLASLYKASEEADFFKTKEEMIKKIKFYLDNDNIRISVSKKGAQRARNDGYDIDSRMARVLDFVK